MNEPGDNKPVRAPAPPDPAKGGRARASVLTAEERREIAQRAAQARWEKQKKRTKEKQVEATTVESSESKVTVEVVAECQESRTSGQMPFAMFSGELTIGSVTIPCHVLNDGRRVLHQRAMVTALGMSRGSSGGEGGDRLAKFVGGSRLKPFLKNNLESVTENPILFKPLNATMAYGYEADVLADICEAVLDARAAGALQQQQQHIAEQCVLLMRGFARVGINALVDEATGYQKVRAKRALQLKLQAFIADELQEWARMFPEEFWWELARLEGVHYSPRSRPLRWGKYVMMFVYDAIDGDVGKELRKKNPDPHFLQNHHQWLKQYGRDKVTIQIEKVITIMKLCNNMGDFREKFARVFKKSPLQMTFEDINWTVNE